MRTIRRHIDTRAATQPDSPYLIAPETGQTLTYADLRRDSIALARYLLALGLKKGETVSFMAHNGLQTARLFLGAMYGGFVVQPINLLSQSAQLEYVLEHSDTRMVFAASEYRGRLDDALAKLGRAIHVVSIDVDAEAIFDAAELAPAPLPAVDEDDDALLMYTSGTTGKPKGCVLTHKNCVAGG
jgi:long-chain acyl-CoA synthetase